MKHIKSKKDNKSRYLNKYQVISMIFTLVILATSQLLFAETYYVNQNHPLANDSNPGTEMEPFETVQKGINTASSRDTVFIKNGNYSLSGYSKNIDQPITILGEDKNLTVIDSIGTLNIIGSSIENMFTLKNVKFTNYLESIINFTVPDGDALDGVEISNCIFDKVEHSRKSRLLLARYDVSPTGIISNINISNCAFLGLVAPGVTYIYLYEGIISNVNITNNNFFNIRSISDTRGATAVNIGNNSNLLTTKDILVSGNVFDTIVADTIGEIETHAILAYGENIRIINNTVRYMVPGTDHEAIYMKGSYSVITNNVMINCTSKQGAIAIKGSGKSFSDTIRNNRVQSNQQGKGIYTAGPESVTMVNNYVKNTYENSIAGLYIYAANGTSCIMNNNYSQTGGDAAYMHDVIGGEIIGNTLISYNAETIDIDNGSTSDITIADNIEHIGWPADQPTSIISSNIIEGEVPLEVDFFSTGSSDPNGEIISYEWNFHDGTTSNEPNPSHIFTEIRTYAVTLIVTDEDGFKDMDYILINANEENITVEVETKNYYNYDLNIYPNPMSLSTNISFQLTSNSAVDISIFNSLGNKINALFHGNLKSGNHRITWNGRNEKGEKLSSGIYIIQCKFDDHLESKQVVIK